MKKFFLLLFILCYSVTVGICQKVAYKKATEIALAVYKRSNLVKDAQIKSLIPVVFKSDTMYYIATFPEKGFTIVSGYDFVPPILGECYTDNFEFKNLPSGLEYLLDKYKNEISSLKDKKAVATKEIKNQWDKILSPQTKSYTVGSHLVPTTWSQNGMYAHYMLPGETVGCTALAMAQILYYWGCRVRSLMHNYMWINMHTNQGDLDNALLIADCSWAAQTENGSSGPGRARDGFVNNFGISNSCNVQWRIWHLSTWQSDLQSEIDLGQPFLYSASSSDLVGHSWVIDGYNSNGAFYCNWGWDGTFNGFYSLGGFNPDGLDNFDQIESAIFTIVPNQPSGVGTPQLSQQIFTYSPSGYQLTVPAVYGASSYEWITNHGTISGTSNTVRLYSDCLDNTVQVRAYNYQCGIYSPYSTAVISLNYGPVSGDQPLCTTKSYSVTNIPSGATITWHSSSNISLPSNINTNPIVATSYGNGEGWIQPTISTSCGSVILPQYTVWVGTPLITNQKVDGSYYSPGMQVCPGNHYLTVTPVGVNAGIATWTVPGNIPYSVGTNLLNFTLPSSVSSVAITVRSSNNCGTSTNWSFYISKKSYGCSGFFGLTVYPNPASDNVTITLDNTIASNLIDENDLSIVEINNSRNIAQVDYTINIYNNQSIRLSSVRRTGNSFNIPLVNMQNGTYIIEVTDGKNSYKHQLIVKHN